MDKARCSNGRRTTTSALEFDCNSGPRDRRPQHYATIEPLRTDGYKDGYQATLRGRVATMPYNHEDLKQPTTKMKLPGPSRSVSARPAETDRAAMLWR